MSLIIKQRNRKNKLYNLAKDCGRIRHKIRENKNFGFKYKIEDFLLFMNFVSPQIYGTRIQNYIINALELNKINSNLDRGDYFDKYGKYGEIKSTLNNYNDEKSNLHLVQIRLYQNIDEYLIFYGNVKNLNNIKFDIFKLSKEQMIEEKEKLKMSSAHMVKNIENKKEYRTSIKTNSESYKRWKEKYFATLEYQKLINFGEKFIKE